MTVTRIVPNIAAPSTAAPKAFSGDIVGLRTAVDLGWIATFAPDEATTPQISIASEGGSGTPVPDLSIEVDDLDEIHRRILAAGHAIEDGPVTEPWGVRRFYVRAPLGLLVNILAHG